MKNQKHWDEIEGAEYEGMPNYPSDRLGQIKYRLGVLDDCGVDCTPWTLEVERDDPTVEGYVRGNVLGGPMGDDQVCSTWLVDTAHFIANAPADIKWLIEQMEAGR